MEKRKTVGFFDSGVGGISVMAYARQRMKNTDFLYYADTKHVPYGTKTREEIVAYADEAVGHLVQRGADGIVVACNTATSMAIEVLREKYSVPIIGMEPAVKPACEKYPDGSILVCATPVTIGGEKLRVLVEQVCHGGDLPHLAPLPELVLYAEQGIFDREIVSGYLRRVLPTEKHYDAVVLGCTHFTYFRENFADVLGNVAIIDGTEGTVSQLIRLLGHSEVGGDDGSTTYFASGEEVTDPDTLAFYHTLEKRALGQ